MISPLPTQLLNRVIAQRIECPASHAAASLYPPYHLYIETKTLPPSLLSGVLYQVDGQGYLLRPSGRCGV
jgi:hypothetical protein